jgi:DNA-binding NarL/FixJ family response regulator
MEKRCRALIVDDDEDMAYLTAMTIKVANHGLEIAGIASSGKDAMQVLTDVDVDVVVLDFRMPFANGLEVASDMLATNPERAIVLFSAFLDESTVDAAHRLGVRECLSKDDLQSLPRVLRKHCPAA